MSKTGLALEGEWRELFLNMGKDPQHPSDWLAEVVEEEAEFPVPLARGRGDETAEKFADDIRRNLYRFCSGHWIDHEFQETKKVIIALVNEVRGFARLLTELQPSDEHARDAFFDVTGGLQIEIQAAVFRFLRRSRPGAAQLILETFRRTDEDVPEWAEPVPASER